MTEIIFDENIDWDKRVLCSDESCIGTVGADGKCKECGKAYDGVLPDAFTEEKESSQATETLASTAPPVMDSEDDWDQRVLCSDGSCIGVIGPDGKCKECGKPL
jgi:hypothetical protein